MLVRTFMMRKPFLLTKRMVCRLCNAMGKNPQSLLWGMMLARLGRCKKFLQWWKCEGGLFNGNDNVTDRFNDVRDGPTIDFPGHCLAILVTALSFFSISCPRKSVSPTAKLAGLPSWWHFYMQWWQCWGQIGLRPLHDIFLNISIPTLSQTHKLYLIGTHWF